MNKLEEIKKEKGSTWPDTEALDEIIVYFSRKYEFKEFKRKVLPYIYTDIFEAVYNRYFYESLKGVYLTTDGKEVSGKITSPIYMNMFAENCGPRIKEDIDRIYSFFGSKSCYELKRQKSASCLELVDFLICQAVPSSYNPNFSNYRKFRVSLDGKKTRMLDPAEEFSLRYDPSI